jgi:hypothetical protein
VQQSKLKMKERWKDERGAAEMERGEREKS